jgi:hypothetical protein
MAGEVRRLNDILAQNQQSFYNLYQSLLQKKKRIEELERMLIAERKESDSREQLLTEKVAETLYELEQAKVIPDQSR